MNLCDATDDDLTRLDATEVTRRLRRLADVEKLIEERSNELTWVNERLVAELYGRSAVEAEADALARYDPVTGLPNRLSFEARMAAVLEQNAAGGEPAAVVLIGLDKLAQVRDTAGFAAGDAAARVLSDRLRLAVRGADLVARIGDDTFALLLTRLRAAGDAAAVARKLHEVIDAPLALDGRTLRLAPALGLAVYPTDGATADLLLARADAAMRHAREQRAGLYQFFRPEIASGLARRLTLEAELRSAVEREQFDVHYQPRFDLKSGRCIGVEALLRWRHPERGLLAPGEFLDVAEASGLIVPIGAQVLRRACRDALGWGARSIVAVNLSPREFLGSGIVDAVSRALAETGVPARRLQIDITEAALTESAAPALAALRQLGVRVVLDDFGAGAASLSALHAMDVDGLKIDARFVQQLPRDKRAAALVAAVIDVARRLRLRVAAEGIETDAQLACLRRLGCVEGQGYRLGRPVAASEVTSIFKTARVARGKKAG
jgi:diguanylate cyclase (GGDEF)-like protein